MKRVLIIIILLGLAGAGWFGYQKYQAVSQPNVRPGASKEAFFIQPGESFNSVMERLHQDYLMDGESFEWVADKMGFSAEQLKAGKFRFKDGMSNRHLVNILRSGRQEPIKMTIRAVRKLEDLSGKIASYMSFDSLEFLSYLEQQYIPNSNYSKENALSLFIPNTYEVFWTLTPEKFVSRMEKEHSRFWDEGRSAKAEALGLSKAEIYTLASIVERETQHKPERKRMAGVYLNRIENGIPLQAGPTVIFAWDDYSIRRVLYRHLEIDNPYNTYKYAGLPPGPIYMPTINAIEAVLNAEDHTYFYFCAKPNSGGAHAFAETLEAHNRNARVYHRWADANGIR